MEKVGFRRIGLALEDTVGWVLHWGTERKETIADVWEFREGLQVGFQSGVGDGGVIHIYSVRGMLSQWHVELAIELEDGIMPLVY